MIDRFEGKIVVVEVDGVTKDFDKLFSLKKQPLMMLLKLKAIK